MKTSEQVKDLLVAMHAARAKFPELLRNTDNPYFNSRYADLAAVIACMAGPAQQHDLLVTQSMTPEGNLVTRVWHCPTGQWIESECQVVSERSTCQSIGSAITYMRRYALKAIWCMQDDDDDDGNAAGQQPATRPAQLQPAKRPEPRPSSDSSDNPIAYSAPEVVGGLMEAKTMAELQRWAGFARHLSEREKVEARQVYDNRKKELGG